MGRPGDGKPEELSWYLEGQIDLSPGLWTAARYGRIDFAEFADTAEWDYDVQRIQIGAGYRLARNAEIRGEWAHTMTSSPVDPEDDLFSVQLWWEF